MLFEVAGRAMVNHVVSAALGLKPKSVVVVVGHGAAEVREAVRADAAFDPKVVRFALQGNPKGTGHALRAALPALRGFRGTVLVLSGDVPLVRTETLRSLADAHRLPYASHGGGPVNLNLLATMPNAIYLETGLLSPASPLTLEDGCALLPQGPGFSW